MLKGKFGLIITLVMVFILALVITGCNGEDDNGIAEPTGDNGEDVAGIPSEDSAVEEDDSSEEEVFTLDELADYDGQDGRRAYIAVNGVVYDVTDVPQWQGAEHFGFSSGIDASDALVNNAPHGASLLNDAVVVGSLAE